MSLIQSKIAFSVVMMIMLAVLTSLLWMRYDSEIKQFKALQLTLMQQQAEQSAKSIDSRLAHIRNQMAAISLDDLWLTNLSHFENKVTLQESLGDRLKLYFPKMYNYVISDSHGHQIGGDIEFLVGDICQADINQMATMFKPDVDYFDYQPYIHPKPDAYHFDVMIPVYAKGQELIFFMSFKPDLLIRILANHIISDHETYLLRTDVPGLIEVTTTQVRDQLQRPIKLTDEELQRIGVTEVVPYSRWQVVVVENPQVIGEFKYAKQVEALTLFLIMFAFWGAVVWLGLHYESRRVRLVSQLNHMSLHDELTGLANRRKLVNEIKYSLDDAQYLGLYAAVIYMDLNGFKEVNDTYGHEQGDAVLVEFGRRLKGLIRSEDVVARLGGDEFVVLLNKLGKDQEKVELVLNETVKRFRQNLDGKYLLHGLEVYCPPSIGVEVIKDEKVTPVDILKRADDKMYRDKKRIKSENASS